MSYFIQRPTILRLDDFPFYSIVIFILVYEKQPRMLETKVQNAKNSLIRTLKLKRSQDFVHPFFLFESSLVISFIGI